MDMFETRQTNMLSTRTNFEWLREFIPNIFKKDVVWESWCNSLSEEEVLRVRTNRSDLEHYIRITSETLVARGSPYDDLWLVYDRLMILLARLDGSIPANYEVNLPVGKNKSSSEDRQEFLRKLTRDELGKHWF